MDTAQQQETAELEDADGPRPEREERDPRFQHARAVSRGERGREMLEHVAMGAELDEGEEQDALDWLLGPPTKTVHDVEVQFETPKGFVPLKFVVQRTDSRKIDKIEQRNISGTTGKLDRLTADIEIVCECCSELVTPRRSLAINSDAFLTVDRGVDGGKFKHAAPPNALEERFKDQLGLISGVSNEIRRIAGYDPERIGGAQRRLVQASLG